MSDPGIAWMAHVRHQLAQLAWPPLDPASDAFFAQHYRANTPQLWHRPPWLRFAVSLDQLAAQLGDGPVEVQANRLRDPRYELHAPRLRQNMGFRQFLARMSDAGNDLYMTAGNGHANTAALRPFWTHQALTPPGFLRRADEAFVWLGADTVTPLHHDLTNNLMCQAIGTKLVRLFAPDQRPRLAVEVGVHSALGWVDNAMIQARGLVVRDIWLRPGDVLFLPVGWWHCVRAYGAALTLVYTNFVWPNYWGQVDAFAA